MNQTSTPSFHLLIIGDEVLSGLRSDSHFAYVQQLLQKNGLQLASSTIVGDARPAITDALAFRLQHGGVLLCTGGIGSTPDDHTRHAAAAALKRPVVRHPQALALIQERIQDMASAQGKTADLNDPLMEGRYGMADFPAGATLIPNPYNKIAGFSILGNATDGAAAGATDLHFFPGFPVMAQPMMAWVLDQYYAAHFGSQQEHRRACRVHGTPEGDLIPLMQALERQFAGVQIYSLPSVNHPEHGPHIELGVKGHDATQVQKAYAWLIDALGLAGGQVSDAKN